jgi:transcriptional regulator with XRE-family HTH domain
MPSAALREKVLVRQQTADPTRLRALRRSLGISQADIAREVGCTPMTISNYERGVRRPRPDLAQRYLAVLRFLQESA